MGAAAGWNGRMTAEERRREQRMRIDSPALLHWATEDGGCEVRATAVDLAARGMRVECGTRLKVDQILWCAVPSYGVYTRARVRHVRGLFRRTAGLEFLAGGLVMSGRRD